MEHMRESSTMPQIVKIARMVVKFHPLLKVTSLILGVIFLQDWIEEELSNRWKILKDYCQSIMRALLDPITEKMKNLSEVVHMHLNIEVAKGQLKVKLIGKLALFSTTFLLLDTELSSKYDKRGIKMMLVLIIGLELLLYSKLWSQLRILRKRCGCIANSTSNFTFFILALVFTKFYDNSLRSLSIVLCFAIYFLCLLVVLRPQTDLGFFSFIIGVIGTIAYNRFEFKFPTWIIAFICFVLFSFKSWLDKCWLDLKDQSLTSTNTTVGSTNVFSILSSTALHIVGTMFMCSVVKPPLSNYKVWLVKAILYVIWNARFHKFYPKDTSLPSTNTIGISGLILTIVNVARGMFMFTVITFPIIGYKDRLVAGISYVVFCIWLINFFPKDLSPPFTNTKGIRNMIFSLQSVATYSIMVLAGLEPHLYYREWLATITFYVLWLVRFGTSIPKDLLLSTTIEFKAQQWWEVLVCSIVVEVIDWMIHLSTRH